MRQLPTGTVTLLFTDIERSTRLLHALGDRYAGVLSDHRRMLRDAFERHGGREVDPQGDSFFVAFADADAAVRAAADAQQSLASEPWPEGRRRFSFAESMTTSVGIGAKGEGQRPTAWP